MQEAANALVSGNRVAAIGFFKDSDSKEAKAYLEVTIMNIMILMELSLLIISND